MLHFVFGALVYLLSGAIVSSGRLVSTPVAISFDNIGTSNEPGGGNFYANGSYVASLLPPAGIFQVKGVNFTLPQYGSGSPDNLIARGQTIKLPEGNFHSIHVLAARDTRKAGSDVSVVYSDGTNKTTQVLVGPWWRWPYPPKGDIMGNYYYTANGTDNNSTHIFHWSASLDFTKNVSSLVLPVPTSNHLHIFAISLLGTSDSDPRKNPVLAVQTVDSTQKWLPKLVAGQKQQIIQVKINNVSPSKDETFWIKEPHLVEVVPTSDSKAKTTTAAVVNRLRPGDQARVQVGIQSQQAALLDVRVVIKNAKTKSILHTSDPFSIQVGLTPYTPEAKSLSRHLSPDWYDDAKFGIFIHWGVYSVPAWSPIVAPFNYAESYQWKQHVPNDTSSPTWVHHKETWGIDFVYDDFLPMWKAEHWDPNEWLDLFVGAGAKYFVLTSKHHDGVALFDTGVTSNRNSLKYGPGRDFVSELFAAARKPAYNGKITPAVYYSMPEWLNPDYAKYGFGSWPGGQAHNAYNYSEIEPYTGHVEIGDFIDDLMFPQMESLLFDKRYGTSILWCDIGGPNRTPELVARWYNEAAARGEQVVMNDRCGIKESDYDTPELSKFSSIQERKWETCEGLDPRSFGYNSNRPWDQYKNTTTIIQNLIDIVSKNGNYLLNVGPMANGTIIQPMTSPLLETGKWLKHSGESIYGTTYWYLGGAQEGAHLRFTTKPDAFYIHSFARPAGGSLRIESPVPILKNDVVKLLGGSGRPLKWEVEDNILTVYVEDEELDRVQWAWSFKVEYRSVTVNV